MAISVKKVTLWRTRVENKPGSLSDVLGPLAEAGANLQVVMGYHYQAAGDTAVIVVCPVSGKKAAAAAGRVGLEAAAIPTLLIQGNDKPGLGHAVAEAIAAAGINITFFVAQVIGKQFSAIMGFDGEAEAKQATSLVKKAVRKVKR